MMQERDLRTYITSLMWPTYVRFQGIPLAESHVISTNTTAKGRSNCLSEHVCWYVRTYMDSQWIRLSTNSPSPAKAAPAPLLLPRSPQYGEIVDTILSLVPPVPSHTPLLLALEVVMVVITLDTVVGEWGCNPLPWLDTATTTIERDCRSVYSPSDG